LYLQLSDVQAIIIFNAKLSYLFLNTFIIVIRSSLAVYQFLPLLVTPLTHLPLHHPFTLWTRYFQGALIARVLSVRELQIQLQLANYTKHI